MTPILEIKNLEKRYADTLDGENLILSGIDLKIGSDEFVCILGPSGCGKTTMLRCIAGFEDFSGDILLNGEKVKEPGPDRTMVFQDFNQLFPWKTVEKNVQYPLKLKGISDKKERTNISNKYLEKVGLLDYAKYYPHQLSGGMKQRVAITRALVMKPKLILMDEPFASLDAMTRRKLQEELLQIKEKENVTIIFITHNIQEALILGTRVLVMNREGKISIDEKNHLEKPITPSTKGYGEMWDMFSKALK